MKETDTRHWVRQKVDFLLGQFEATMPNDTDHLKEFADELELWASQLRTEIQYRKDNPDIANAKTLEEKLALMMARKKR